jgi:predicted amidohydrolase
MSLFQREGLKVCLIQTVIQQGQKEENWARALALFDRAIAEAPRLVVFPEAFASGVNFIILRQMAEPVPDGPTFRRLEAMARRAGVFICAGILELGADDRVYDSAVLVGPDGSLLATYRRRFLWVGERNYVTPGRGPAIVATDIGVIGLILGYDICFPPACDAALARDVDVIICPASVFRPLSHNAEALAAARAMDHHCYFLYANAVGFHQFANMHYGGNSAIYADPYFLQVQLGEPYREGLGRVAQAGSGEAVVAGELYLQELAKARKSKLPFKGDALYTGGVAAAAGGLAPAAAN